MGWDGDGDGMGMGWGWDGDGMGMGWGWGGDKNIGRNRQFLSGYNPGNLNQLSRFKNKRVLFPQDCYEEARQHESGQHLHEGEGGDKVSRNVPLLYTPKRKDIVKPKRRLYDNSTNIPEKRVTRGNKNKPSTDIPERRVTRGNKNTPSTDIPERRVTRGNKNKQKTQNTKH